jgi:hypothetical protein
MFCLLLLHCELLLLCTKAVLRRATACFTRYIALVLCKLTAWLSHTDFCQKKKQRDTLLLNAKLWMELAYGSIVLTPFRFTSPHRIPILYILLILFVILQKNILLETYVVVLSNDIIFILYNLYYINKIGFLKIRRGLVNSNGGCNAR